MISFLYLFSLLQKSLYRSSLETICVLYANSALYFIIFSSVSPNPTHAVSNQPHPPGVRRSSPPREDLQLVRPRQEPTLHKELVPQRRQDFGQLDRRRRASA